MSTKPLSHRRELFFHDSEYLWVVERVQSATDFKFSGPARRLFKIPLALQVAGGQWAPGWDVTPDGKRFLVANPPPDAPGPIAIVTNWGRRVIDRKGSVGGSAAWH